MLSALQPQIPSQSQKKKMQVDLHDMLSEISYLWGTLQALRLYRQLPARALSMYSRSRWSRQSGPPRRWCWPLLLYSRGEWRGSGASSAGFGSLNRRHLRTCRVAKLPPVPSPQSCSRWYCGSGSGRGRRGRSEDSSIYILRLLFFVFLLISFIHTK